MNILTMTAAERTLQYLESFIEGIDREIERLEERKTAAEDIKREVERLVMNEREQ